MKIEDNLFIVFRLVKKIRSDKEFWNSLQFSSKQKKNYLTKQEQALRRYLFSDAFKSKSKNGSKRYTIFNTGRFSNTFLRERPTNYSVHPSVHPSGTPVSSIQRLPLLKITKIGGFFWVVPIKSNLKRSSEETDSETWYKKQQM